MNKIKVSEEIHRAVERTHIGVRPRLVRVDVRKPYVVVEVASKQRSGIGFAKCSPHDTWNEDIGETIATFRAVRDLQQQLGA